MAFCLQGLIKLFLGMSCANYMGGYYCDAGEACPLNSKKYYRRNGCCQYDGSESCGQPHSFHGRIYSGIDAKRKQWPWMVYIQYRPPGKNQQIN